LPGTGFAPQRVTVLSAQPAEKAYTTMGDLWLEIPKLGVKMNIVGVPQSNGKWDVSWLGNQAGWLNGSAFPTWAGNSVLTGHVWNADNTAGPFRYINTLWWGDKVVVHAWGAQYVYQVRSVMQVGPGNTNAMMKHEELPWVTLLTCRGFDQASNSYKYRVLVRAVLIEVK
jgi:LPXTG-site transpeptidase (sortase) family protein